ncbi:MAG: hypothetical protein J2P26_14380, partial [Nocardiopsaceae bacterium]|nr:hypothetical protein [Nocardiopsaceae bacterium]
MDEEPLLDLVIRQLPPGTRRELGIPGLTLARDGSVRFRLDPRQAFERAARVTRAHSGDLRLAVSQRYRPHDEMELLKDELVTQPETSLADHLRTQLGFADWQETRPHWQRTYPRQHPEKTR